MKSISDYINSPWGSNIVYVLWITIVVIFGIFFGILKKSMIRFGPPLPGEKELIFLGTKITSWGMILAIIAYSFINQLVSSHHSNMYYPWITNNIHDDKVKKIDMKRQDIIMMMNIDNIFGWINYFIDLNILFTMEFQFILPRMIASVIVNNTAIHKYLKNKKCLSDKND